MWLRRDKKNSPSTLSSKEPFTFLGKGAKFKGVISFDGEIRIDAKLEGEIHTKGTLVVGDHAVIEGDVSAGTVVSSGKINGNVTAADKVRLLAPGVVVGNIRTPILSVEEGVRFSGNCEAEGMGELRTLEAAREAAAQGGPTRARGVS